MPRIIEITAGAATSFNHPYESYANFKPSITLKAVIGENEDPIYCIQNLQRQAHDFVEAEKQRTLAALKREHEIERLESCIESYTREIERTSKLIEAGAEFLQKLPEQSWDHSRLKDEIEEAPRRLAEAKDNLVKAQDLLAALRVS